MRSSTGLLRSAARPGALVSLLVGLLSACASFPRTPAHPQDDPRFRPPKRVVPPGIPDDRAAPLVLLPGDKLMVETVSTTTTQISVVIDGLGQVHVPLAGDVEVAGLTMSAAEKRLKTALQRYDKYVHVNLRLEDPTGHTVTVLGAVRTPGVVPLTPGARLSDVLLMAGGELIDAVNGQMVSGSDMVGAELLRDGKPLPVDFRRAMAGDPLHNVFVRAGDHINVPPQKGENIIVLGALGGTVFQWAPGMRLTEALARSGGVPPAGDKNDIRVIRGPLEAPRVYQSSLRDIVDGETHDVELYPGDIVWVEDHWIEDFGEVMAVISPLLNTSFSVAAVMIALNRTN